jgi:uncharacterized protein YpiB (UPF0302 family)
MLFLFQHAFEKRIDKYMLNYVKRRSNFPDVIWFIDIIIAGI